MRREVCRARCYLPRDYALGNPQFYAAFVNCHAAFDECFPLQGGAVPATGVQGVCCRSSWQATTLESKADFTLPTALRIIQFIVSEASAPASESPAQLEPEPTASGTPWAVPAGWRVGGLCTRPRSSSRWAWPRGVQGHLFSEQGVLGQNQMPRGKRRPGGLLWCQGHNGKESSYLP